MIVDPWGTVLAKCVDDPARQQEHGAICVAEWVRFLAPRVVLWPSETDVTSIDLGWLERVRQDMPLWEQRREDVYELKSMN
jgi:predicted amidohydrolase